MSFALRGIMPFVVLIFVALASMGAVAGANAEERGIPKSVPAFTKFVAEFVQEAMPQAKVTVTGPLQLDVDVPGGGHTTYLNNIYATCQRNRDTCIVDVTGFVGEMVALYQEAPAAPTRSALRVVVRPSAYLAQVRAHPGRNRPIAAPLAGDLWLVAVEDRPTTIEILDEDDLGALKLTAKDALALAIANTRRTLARSVQNEFARDTRRGVLGGDLYTASALAFSDLWAAEAHVCKDNLLVAVPSDNAVFYTDGSGPGAMQSLRHVADDFMATADKPFSNQVFRWSGKGWMPVQ